MFVLLLLVVLSLNQGTYGQTWNISSEVARPWESYLQLGEIQRPLGLTLNRSSAAHYHFYVGYLALHSFMYDTAHDAFDLAINASSGTLVEGYIGKMLGCKHTLWAYTDFTCARTIYPIVNASRLSDFQRALLTTVNLWFINESAVTQGEYAFLNSIANLSALYSNETDIQVLHGLALLNVADQAQFQNLTEPERMKQSRTVLLNALSKEPNHPGALHYLIHAYDVPIMNVAEQGRPYAVAYGNLVKTSSHGQHMPSHIWLRLGEWRLAALADSTAIRTSHTLCAIKLLNRAMNTTTSLELSPIWNQTNQNVSFLRCDDENRAHSMEWLAYTSLQIGDWPTCRLLARDLYRSYNATSTLTSHYLPFAYRTQARTIIELFYWFPYKPQFINRTNELLSFFGTGAIISVNDNETHFYPFWAEAGLRLSECLRILSTRNTSVGNLALIDVHVNRLSNIANLTSRLNQYVSNHTSVMINQIRGIQAFVNGFWQDCLNQLNTAVQREAQIVTDANSPTLGFARSAELLAIHLLLIYDQSVTTMRASLPSTFTLNNQTVSISSFPSLALGLYQTVNATAPNRAVGLLGMGQAYTKLQNRNEAARIYNLLRDQLSVSNTTDNSFLQEVQNFLNQLPSKATHFSLHQPSLTIISILFVLYFFSHCQ